MPGLRDLWRRFRPIGAPGAPSAAGVPVDQRARAEAELEPVFAALAGTDQTCVELRRVGAALARGRLTEARAQAEMVVATAERAAPEERARAAAEAESQARTDLARVEEEQAHETARVRDSSQSILPDLVRDALGQMVADIAALNATPGGPPRPERP